MNLSPTEMERLTIFVAAEVARRNLRAGVKLNQPEAVAYLTDEAMLMARQDVPYPEIRDRVGGLLTSNQVLDGVGAMIPIIMMELPLSEGTKLMAIYDPIPASTKGLIPGEVITGQNRPEMFPESTLIQLEVVNQGDRDIQVRSFTHFFEVNRALKFDRAKTYGYRLAVPAGGGVRFEPGLPRTVALTPISGERQVWGGAGLVEGDLDDPAVRQRAFDRAREYGYDLPGEAA
ncbi:MAG: urease subunit beta [Bifidobacteriaceae bacterium]|jgi:urease subunit gamma/beta|nr:urease subunit beta [Bifidobacteriaceae bacterium]